MALLGVTARCIEDLQDLEDAAVDALQQKYIELRGQAPDSGEPIAGLRERPCKSLHASRYRAVTWYDRDHDVVWLLAAGIHREDSHADSYDLAIALEQSGRLYPTPADYAQIAAQRQVDQLQHAARELRTLRDDLLATDQRDHRFVSVVDGIEVTMWIEQIEEIAQVVVYINRQRKGGAWVTDEEVTLLLAGPLGEHCRQRFDTAPPFACYESYIE